MVVVDEEEEKEKISGKLPTPSPKKSKSMESMVNKYQQKFKKSREEMDRWDTLQCRLISQFSNASFIIDRLQVEFHLPIWVIQNKKNYGALKCVDGIEEAVLRNQMETLNTILVSINRTMEEFHGIVLSLQKIVRDGRQLVKGGTRPLSAKQLQQRIGVKPCLADCLDGLAVLHEMYRAEYGSRFLVPNPFMLDSYILLACIALVNLVGLCLYLKGTSAAEWYLLKSSVVSALPTLALKSSAADLGALQQLLVDQPNIPREELQHIFDVVFAEDIC
ncbi:hypothetical protein AKJ16_DCAP11406 [Drosera capensis]